MRTADFETSWLLAQSIAAEWDVDGTDGECGDELRAAAQAWWNELDVAETRGVSFGAEDGSLFEALRALAVGDGGSWDDGHTDIAIAPNAGGGVFIVTRSPDTIEFVPRAVVDALADLQNVQGFSVHAIDGGGWRFEFDGEDS
jgi:hypothetical protein